MNATASRSASGNTRLADLPPSSSTAGFSVSAQVARILRAAVGPPVKLIFCTSGWRTSASPASAVPGSTLTTPGGIPASRTRAMKCSMA